MRPGRSGRLRGAPGSGHAPPRYGARWSRRSSPSPCRSWPARGSCSTVFSASRGSIPASTPPAWYRWACRCPRPAIQAFPTSSVSGCWRSNGSPRAPRLAEQRLAEIPGVTAAGLATEIPPDLSGGNDNFNLVDHPVPPGQAEPTSPWYYVTAGYFRALGVPLLDGRLFTAADTLNDYPMVVVSRSWARRYFPNERATGRRLIQGGCSSCPRTTIIGVVGDIKNLGPAGAEEAVYRSEEHTSELQSLAYLV